MIWKHRSIEASLAKLGTVGLGTASCFAKHLFASGTGHWRSLDTLAIGGDPRLRVFHALDLRLVNAPEKPRNFNASILVQNY